MSDVNLMADDQTKGSHTPGPWTLNADAHRHEPGFYGTPNEPGEKEVYTAIRIGESGVRLTGYMLPADANLIAAAPELLKALKYLQRHYVGQLENARDRIVSLGGECDPVDVMERGDPHLRVVREVIAKAEGRS